ncbi:MAG TPA: ion channel [Xanthobacteraceae bacterium]|nr:ion channel [Xanthobacteraceae bacterium]
MIANLSLAALLTAVVIVIHLAGLLILLHFLRRNARHALGGEGLRYSFRQGAMVFAVVLGIFLLHGLEISVYGLAYVAVGAFRDFETALYFSASAFSTLGFGDVVLGPQWRMLSAVEGVSGLILIGWSSGFLLSVTSRLRLLEHEWEAYAERDRKF